MEVQSKYLTVTIWFIISIMIVSCSESAQIREELSKKEQNLLVEIFKTKEVAEELWDGFSYISSFPIYILIDRNTGFLINPPLEAQNESVEIHTNNKDLSDQKIYRNDNFRYFVASVLEGDRWWATVSPYQGVDMFILQSRDQLGSKDFYLTYKNQNGFLDVSGFVHELFHTFQLQYDRDKWFPTNTVLFKPEPIYPLNEETLPLQLLLFDVMIDALGAGSKAEQRKILEYYVAIQSRLEEVDTSPGKLIRNKGFMLEKLEGPARYIEEFSTDIALGNNLRSDPTHGFADYATQISDAEDMRWVYSARIFYHTGSGAIHLLKVLGFKDLESQFLIPENTIFDMADSFLDMKASDKLLSLSEAKMTYDWDTKIERAKYLLSL